MLRLSRGRLQLLPLLMAAAQLVVVFRAVPAESSSRLGASVGGTVAPYTNASFLTVLPFGEFSHWIQPWRSYTATPHVSVLLDGVGINLDVQNNVHGPALNRSIEWVLQHLHNSGFRHARIEVGWNSLNYSSPHQLLSYREESLRTVLQLCQQHKIRPMLLLNGNSGGPCPNVAFMAPLAKAGKAGDTTITLGKLPANTPIVANRTGLSAQLTHDMAELLFTSVDGNTVTLSQPLPKDIPANKPISMATLRYAPFSPVDTLGGAETMRGWQGYAVGVATFAAQALGTAGTADVGFDMELWNELSFGSDFLSINHYYPKAAPLYPQWGYASDSIVNATAAVAAANPAAFAGVLFNNGFSNTIPWPGSGGLPTRIHSIGKHPYPGGHSYPKDQEHGFPVDAFGNRAADQAPDHSEGGIFNATYTIAGFPEYYWGAYQTETLVRDASPFNNYIGSNESIANCHGRFCRGKDNPSPMWVTEVNMGPGQTYSWGRTDGKQITDEAALAMKAKIVTRFLTFFPHKGIERVYLYNDVSNMAVGGGDTGLAVVGDRFMNYTLAAPPDAPFPDTATEQSLSSPAVLALTRLFATLGQGRVHGDTTAGADTDLSIVSLSETHGHYQWEGSQTDPRFPNLFNRELFVWLPARVNDTRWVAPYYVMTQNITDDLPPEEYSLVITTPVGEAYQRGSAPTVQVACFDPILNQPCPTTLEAQQRSSGMRELDTEVQLERGPQSTMTLQVEATDYPRVITFDFIDG